MKYLGIDSTGLAVSGIWLYEPTNALPAGQTAQEITGYATIGWTWNGTDWVAPSDWEEPTVSVGQLRVERDKLLASSDFTQLPDVLSSTDRSTWATYRQELRDLPDGYITVAHPDYPVRP